MEVTTLGQTWSNLALSITYGVVSVIMSAVTLYLLDRFLYRNIDFIEEIKRGNMAASVFYSVLLLFVGLVVTLSVN